MRTEVRRRRPPTQLRGRASIGLSPASRRRLRRRSATAGVASSTRSEGGTGTVLDPQGKVRPSRRGRAGVQGGVMFLRQPSSSSRTTCILEVSEVGNGAKPQRVVSYFEENDQGKSGPTLATSPPYIITAGSCLRSGGSHPTLAPKRSPTPFFAARTARRDDGCHPSEPQEPGPRLAVPPASVAVGCQRIWRIRDACSHKRNLQSP